MIKSFLISVALATMPVLAAAQAPAKPDDSAARFGALEAIADVSLSPDGTKVAYVAPREGQGSAVYTVELATNQGHVATAVDGKPLRLSGCSWVSNDRLLCTIFALHKVQEYYIVSTRLVGVDADGSDFKLVSQRPGEDARGFSSFGGQVIDWLPQENGAVLMAREFIPEGRTGSLVERRGDGFGVERIDTRTLRTERVEPARRDAVEYISDGRGNIRIMGTAAKVGDGYETGKITYFYRRPGSRDWHRLSTYDVIDRSGFNPYAVDPDANAAYGFKKRDGRMALYRVPLDGSAGEELVYGRSDVDIDGLVRIGRDRRVVGLSYATDKRHRVHFDKDVSAMAASLAKALPNMDIQVVDSSLDGKKMLIWAGSDVDPGNYFVFDREARRLNKILLVRPELAGVTLGEVKPVKYRASDGTMVPAYLTLPPGSSGRNLPAIVMPHGGPEARDEWGFDWLAQYYVNRGYAVLQPNFRGSTGYGDEWFMNNGFRSWRAAVGDVVDAGRWLVAERIADPAKLGIVGWSYGGYAALQSSVIAPDLFKGVVAIAPVTDFRLTIDESRGWSNWRLERERIGSGPHIREGSPAQNASAIKAPVLLLHGDMDRNVEIKQSRLMADRLRDAGKRHELVVYDGLDHYLADSRTRADLLRRSDQFLRGAMGM